MCTVGKLDPSGLGRLGGMVGKCQMHCLCPGGPSGWVLHRLKSLAKSGMAADCSWNSKKWQRQLHVHRNQGSVRPEARAADPALP